MAGKWVNDNVTVDLDHVDDAVKELLSDYSAETIARIDDAVVDTAKESRDVVRTKANAENPRNGKFRFPNRFGKYKRSIAYKKTERGEFNISATVYARGHEYSLTHLLEHGHKLWQSPTRKTRAFAHWKIGEEYAIKWLPKHIIWNLKK